MEEKKINFQLRIENYWNPNENFFLIMNPAGYFPILLTSRNYPVVGSSVIMEYLEDLDNENFYLTMMLNLKLDD